MIAHLSVSIHTSIISEDYYEYRAPTERELLKIALPLVARAGAHAMSFQKLADAMPLPLSKASVHYYFPTKSDLLGALVDGYRSGFLHDLRTRVDRCPTRAIKLRQYFAVFNPMLFHREVCPCGMLAAEAVTLKQKIVDQVFGFFDESAKELTKILNTGREDGSLRFEGPSEPLAWMILSLIEGALLLARLNDNYRLVNELRLALERLIVAPGHEQKRVTNVEIVAGGAVQEPLAVVLFAKSGQKPSSIEWAPEETPPAAPAGA